MDILFNKEPQVIKEWREKQMEHLKVKDEEEEVAKNNLKAQAAKVNMKNPIV